MRLFKNYKFDEDFNQASQSLNCASFINPIVISQITCKNHLKSDLKKSR